MSKEVFAIVLAAGTATRFGSTKQLASFEGQSLVAAAHEKAASACYARTVCVVGHDAPAVVAEIRGASGFIVVNDDYADGLGTSLAKAIRSIRHVASAVVVLLADQPAIQAGHIRSLIAAWDGKEDMIIATAFAGSAGPPVLFASGSFDELAVLEGDVGGKHLFDDPRFRFETVVHEPAGFDVDTPDDLRRT